jgi:hypothetical protein
MEGRVIGEHKSMANPLRNLLFCGVALAFVAVAQTPSARPELTARELFYNATEEAKPSTQKTAPAQKTQPKQVASKKNNSKVQTAKNDSPSAATPSSGGTVISHPTAPILTASDDVPARTSAPAPASGTPLGLKYTILKLVGDAMTPVAPSAVFHAYDKIQFSIEANGPGYLYIISQGSSGVWKPMFPSPEIEGGNNHVEGFHTYTFPQGYRFAFDNQPGDEKFFLVLSRDPKPDFQEMVYALQAPKGAPAPREAPKQAPVSAPDAGSAKGPLLRASVDGATVGRLQHVYARDLVIEKIGDDAAAKSDTQEKAVYVVNASGNSDSVVVADLHLVHQ